MTKTKDICERKHGGNPESEAAHRKIANRLTKDQLKILSIISDWTNIGVTSKEIAGELDRPLNAISGRFTELAKRGFIERNGKRWEGAAVWVSTEDGDNFLRRSA